MDLITAIGMISALVTIEEAGRSWLEIVKDRLKKKEVDLNNWDSEDPIVQMSLDKFKTEMRPAMKSQ